MDYYLDPLIYDLIYDGGTADQWRTLQLLAERFEVSADGVWLEPACGSGRLLVAAAAAGIAVAGFDREPRMLEFARGRLPKSAQLFEADYLDCATRLAPQKFAFAFNLVNSIRHLESDAALIGHLDQMAALLAPNARYLVGLSLHDPATAEVEEDVFRGSRDGVTAVEVVQSLPPEPGERSELIVSHLTIERPGVAPEHRDTSFSLRTYTAEEWEGAVAASQLRIDETFNLWGDRFTPVGGTYGLYSLVPGLVAE